MQIVLQERFSYEGFCQILPTPFQKYAVFGGGRDREGAEGAERKRGSGPQRFISQSQNLPAAI